VYSGTRVARQDVDVCMCGAAPTCCCWSWASLRGRLLPVLLLDALPVPRCLLGDGAVSCSHTERQALNLQPLMKEVGTGLATKDSSACLR
jgi:hypothetical protein